MKKHPVHIVWFKRDLRIVDNEALFHAHQCDLPLLLIYVFEPSVMDYDDADVRHWRFIYESIQDLNTKLKPFNSKIYFFHNEVKTVFSELIQKFEDDLKWHVKNVVIGSMRNWSKTALEWNLANNAAFGPHTDGGCDTCKGALTINGSDSFSRNVGFYIISHASKFVPAGSVRIASNQTANLNSVAFKTPAGKTVLIIENDGSTNELFNIKSNGKWVTTAIDAGAVATFIW